MRIAILIGVADYQNLDDLPATSTDVEAMQRFLEATGNYPQILVYAGRTIAAEIRTAVPARLEAFSDQEVEEVFFYFSGHGFERDEQSFFATSDYDDSSPYLSSLPNSLVDEWLRNLRPAVAVKVIDCCESGVRYVKSRGADSGLQARRAREFHDLYFFHSSHWTQDSHVDGALSLFTRRFLQVVADMPDGPVRYGEINLGLSDAFLDESQTPQMLTAGDYQQSLCTLTEEVRSVARHYAQLGLVSESEASDEQEVQSALNQGSLSRTEELRLEARECIDEEDASAALEQVRSIADGLGPTGELAELFRYELKYRGGSLHNWADDDEIELAQAETLGKWLKRRENRHFFAVPVETEPKERPISLSELALDPFANRMIPARVIGFLPTAALSFDWLRLRALPELSILPAFELGFVPLWSRKKLAVLSYHCRLEESHWGEWHQPRAVRWKRWNLTKRSLRSLPDLFQQLLAEFERSLAESAGLGRVSAVAKTK